MLITPVKNVSNANNIKYIQPTFKASVKQLEIPKAHLKRDTSILISDILHAYREVLSKLELKTEKGLEILAQKYPDVKIGDVLVFHNCGPENNSITISTGEVAKHKGLTYFSRREGYKRSEKHNVLEAFMVEGNERMLKNFDVEHSMRFPTERVYLNQEELSNSDKEEKLNKLLQELDFAMLKFRKFLDKNMNDNLKLPDGRIPYQHLENMKLALKMSDYITERSTKIHRLKMLDLNKDFEQYCALTGLKSYMFKDLGEEKVAINLSQVNREGEDLKRLSVYDREGKPLRTFLIKNNEKFISNLTQAKPTYIPVKYSYADTKEMEEKYLPEFNKYIKLYLDKLTEYRNYIDNYIKTQEDKKMIGKLAPEVNQLLKESLDLYQRAKKTFEGIHTKKAVAIKRQVGGLKPDFDKKGVWFNDTERNKTMQILPIKNKRHQGLCRLTVIDNETNELQMFLIKDFTFIVRNYNKDIPENIPPKLFYASIAEVEDANLEQYCRFIRRKMEELNAYADYAYDNRNMVEPKKKEVKPKVQKSDKEKELERLKRKERREAEKVQRAEELARKKAEKIREKELEKIFKEEYKNIVKTCKEKFSEALYNLDNGLAEFNKAMQEIQQKVTEFYIQNKKVV